MACLSDAKKDMCFHEDLLGYAEQAKLHQYAKSVYKDNARVDEKSQ